jgi:two-component system nitrate/nitrite response regulator NarL
MRGVSTVLVEPSTLFREGLGKLLANSGFIVTTMVSGPEDIEAEHTLEPQLIILGTKPNDDNFVNNMRMLRDNFPDSCFVVLADHYCPEQVHAAFRLSARGYLMKNINFSTLVKSLELIMLGESVFPSAMLTRWDDQRDAYIEFDDDVASVDQPTVNSPCLLSNREAEILQCLVQGQSNKIIARNLNIVEATVKVHIKAILRKIRVQNRTQAAIWAINHQDAVPRTDAASAPAYRSNGMHTAGGGVGYRS